MLLRLRALPRHDRGAATIEFALMVSFLAVAMLCGVDVADYHVHRLQVESSAQMGAQAASTSCDSTQVPATLNCPGLSAAVTTAVQSTSLGTSVTVQTGYPSEGWYCVTSAGALQYVSAPASQPADCSSVGKASDQPGDYLTVKTQYTYQPIFNAMSFASIIPTSITSTAMVRLK